MAGSSSIIKIDGSVSTPDLTDVTGVAQELSGPRVWRVRSQQGQNSVRPCCSRMQSSRLTSRSSVSTPPCHPISPAGPRYHFVPSAWAHERNDPPPEIISA